MSNPDVVRTMAHRLRAHATHFVQEDWAYTRDLGDLRRLVYAPTPYEHWARRLGRALTALNPWHRFDSVWERDLLGDPGWRYRWARVKVALRRDRRLPDGRLDDGGILVVWEETGEYLQYVQPSVGEMLADLMDAHPDLPEVRAIAAEMQRIQDGYAARVAETEADRPDEC